MKRFNLSEWALGHRSVVAYFMLVIVVAGIGSYLRLGRSEDPDFTVKTMVVQTSWPSATVGDTLDYQQGLGRTAPVQAASSPSDRDATGSLPGGWMPMENDCPACARLASSSAGCAFAAQIGRHSHLHELAVS